MTASEANISLAKWNRKLQAKYSKLSVEEKTL